MLLAGQRLDALPRRVDDLLPVLLHPLACDLCCALPDLLREVATLVDGFSSNVSAGNTLFSLLGFMGMYSLLSILFLLLLWRELMHGPDFLGGKEPPPGSSVIPQTAEG